ncbi:bifunctional UDP-N-acetylglucosamine diphosphorylase/glucosamine-1-phosphate N-acetyltransferase GlmU [Fuchsiella alkaliacetigena]|uniref:bifunctional UDP-N-acetylglucosamine diphosphorylase/glucosamine-1-phosphate N-acetyltransferase GlmU n=1 Tax=Fuchsiella alkaliacetigena TaxID=957042 RepID=UPI00200A5802|nr:bifunctional UDP-N-acetylglucosamine diphosphorylase/glucosamine-1-phosphate N-acetyltransferase GlmU [Fuchsiella alkaliacetigena]MCK8824917.1 bifunctional UDP-N-acetylglucosamine diphosphorylase/glucosamine-1-phosphate N-acetyltransferase GlmU [Fuchsiella alkaliacetigena]
MDRLAVVVLAAGKGTRMKSELPKVLHKVCGKAMVEHILFAAQDLNPERSIVVVGYKGEIVKAELESLEVDFAYQKQQLGTGHAVMQVEEFLQDFEGSVLVLCGDTPLLTAETLSNLVEKQQQQGVAAVLTTEVDDPSWYGRIVRDSSGDLVKIVEEEDATPEERQIQEINTGTYCFDSQYLFKALQEIEADNAQGEYYLTDVIEVLTYEGENVAAELAVDSAETLGVNTRRHLATAEKRLRKRVCNKHLAAGVTIIDPENTFIDSEVEIEQDTVIYPYTIIEGATQIGSNCTIGPHSRIIDSQLAAGVEVQNSVIKKAKVGAEVQIGPFAYLRPGTELEAGVKIGDFVEIKKSKVAQRTKIPHLSYVGDAEIGEDVNIGAGTIIANYDGQEKHRTEIGDQAFIGSNSTLIAPLNIGKSAITGAGSVVTKDVAADSLVLGVPATECEINKEDND